MRVRDLSDPKFGDLVLDLRFDSKPDPDRLSTRHSKPKTGSLTSNNRISTPQTSYENRSNGLASIRWYDILVHVQVPA